MKLRPLALGDLVLRKIVGIARNPAWGKVRAQLGKAIPYHLVS